MRERGNIGGERARWEWEMTMTMTCEQKKVIDLYRQEKRIAKGKV